MLRCLLRVATARSACRRPLAFQIHGAWEGKSEGHQQRGRHMLRPKPSMPHLPKAKSKLTTLPGTLQCSRHMQAPGPNPVTGSAQLWGSPDETDRPAAGKHRQAHLVAGGRGLRVAADATVSRRAPLVGCAGAQLIMAVLPSGGAGPPPPLVAACNM